MRLSHALGALAIACGPATADRAPDAPQPDDVESAPGSATLEGVVIDVASDRPVSLAGVRVYNDGGELVGEATTDSAGRYRIPNLAPGSYRVVVEFSSLRAEARGVTLLADRSTPLRMQLSSHAPASAGERESRVDHGAALGAIEGVVLDGVRGEPLGGATIEVSSPSIGDPLFTIADERGRFRVPGLAPGTYLVSVYYSLIDKGNIEIRRSGVAVERGKATRLTLELDTEVR